MAHPFTFFELVPQLSVRFLSIAEAPTLWILWKIIPINTVHFLLLTVESITMPIPHSAIIASSATNPISQ
jgi:hypothetical protein